MDNYVLLYYALFWVLNVAAYAAVSRGLKGWCKFVQGLDAERMLKAGYWITTAFGATRFVVGSAGLMLYVADILTAIHAVVAIGMTSLALNTMFIFGQGYFLRREAKLAQQLPPEKQNLVRRGISTFESLRRAINA